MTADMEFQCLLVSRDSGVVCALDPWLTNLSIRTQVCSSSSQAREQLSSGSIDLIVLDWEDDAAELLGSMQRTDAWQKAVVVAISPAASPVEGADIILHKPVTEESGEVSLRAAYSRMLYVHRRRTRYPLVSSVQTTDGDNQSLDVTITDIGDGGFGFVSKREVSVGDVLQLRLFPPGAERPITLEGRVRWTRNYGAAGCEYLHIPPADLGILDGWLKSKTQIKRPLVDV